MNQYTQAAKQFKDEAREMYLVAYNFLMKKTRGDKHLSQSLAQDSMVKISRAVKSASFSNLPAYVRMTALNEFRQKMRKDRRIKRKFIVEDFGGNLNSIPYKERETSLTEIWKTVEEEGNYEESLRQASGESYEEIARGANKPVGTIKSRINRQRASLKCLLLRKHRKTLEELEFI